MKVMMFLASSLDGGAEKVVADLSNELEQQNTQVIIAAFKDSLWLERLNPKIKVYQLTSSEAWCDPRLYWQLAKIIKQEQPDIVHSHAAKASKIIQRLSRLTPLVQIASKHNSRKGKVFNTLPHVTAVSARVSESIKQPSKIIYNGVKRQTELTPQTQKLPLSLLAVGRLDPIKRFDWLIKEIARCNLDCSLDIVGEGPQKTELEQIIHSLGLTNKVRLLGQQKDIAKRMSEKSAVIIASRSEGFSLVMIEALFYSNLLLSTEVGAAPELLPKNFLIKEDKLAEKLLETAKNYEGFCAEYNRFTLEQAANFELRKVASNYLDYYHAILTQVRTL